MDKASEQAYNSIFQLNLHSENLVLLKLKKFSDFFSAHWESKISNVRKNFIFFLGFSGQLSRKTVEKIAFYTMTVKYA